MTKSTKPQSICQGWLRDLLVITSLLNITAITAVSAESNGQADAIDWRGSSVPAPFGTGPEAVAMLNDHAASHRHHLVIRFRQSVEPALREELEQSGLRLLSYLGNHAYFAALDPERLDGETLSRTANLVGIQTVHRQYKLHPQFQTAGNNDTSSTPAYVIFHRDVELTAEAAPVCIRHNATIRSRLRTINGFVIELPYNRIQGLADEDVVQWIEPALPPLGETNDSNRILTQADSVQEPPYGLDGNGVGVLVYDVGGVDPDHPDFAGRLVSGDDIPPANHSTHVAGTVAGDGYASNGLYRGMAPGASLVSYAIGNDGFGLPLYSDPGDLESDYRQAINLHDIDIATNSVGTNTCRNGFLCEITGNYGVTSAVIDSIISGGLGKRITVFFANGNERSCERCRDEGVHTPEGYHSTAPPACAKNHIAVGAVNSGDDSVTFFTSWGPTDDGRLKPDIVGPGCQQTDDNGVTSCQIGGDYITYCGTSMATPTVAGLTALLLQDMREQLPARPTPLNSTVKALLAHNATDIAAPGPDYQSGYGSVRIRRTIDFTRTGNFREQSLDQGEEASYLVRVDPGETTLKITLAWDDAPGTANVNQALINDLDLVVYDPSQTRHYPWTLNPNYPAALAGQNQPDHLNNIEQVLVDNPIAGYWTVVVQTYDIPEGPQEFSICASPRLALDCDSDGIPDDEEILADPSLDCTTNGILDECEPDCNENSQADSCDIADGISIDCDGNGVPDECEPDCNENEISDACDILGGTSADCDDNGVPDECEDTSADCNENDVWDACDISDGFSLDLNFNGVPDECEQPRTIHVDDDAPGDPAPGDSTDSDPDEDGGPEHPFDAIQEAIDVALDGDTIILADGVYNWVGNTNLNFSGKAVTLRSESGPQECVIDCEEIFRGFSFDSGETPATQVEGVTIRNGFDGFWGGAVFCDQSSPALVGCVFENSWAVVGGAAYIRDADPVFIDCLFVDNWGGYGGGIFVTGNSSLVMNGCNFTNNTGMLGGGAAVFFGSGTTRLENCVFWQNDTTGTNSSHGEGGAILASGNAVLINSLFEDNFVYGNGGAIFCRIGSNITLTNCALINNTAIGPYSNGGGLALLDVNGATVTGCTLVGNTAGNRGGGISSLYGAGPALLNCILWKNQDISGETETAQFHNNAAYPSVRYCCIQGLTGLYGGLGNLGDDPLMLDPDTGNYHISPDSPCINAGDHAFLPLPDERDIDGEERVLLDRVDIGSDEYAYDLTDCNGNGIPDSEDIAAQTSADCNENAIPDECEIELGYKRDCNENGIIDSCDIAEETSLDCGGNGVPDECEPDCNENGNPDDCDIANATSLDCNLSNIPDECESDCNENGIADECDLIDGTSADFNNNAIPDECEENRTINVDDNAPGDPGPGVTYVSDIDEDGSSAHPFDAIQEAIDAAISGDVVLLADGVYTGYGNKNLEFRGRQLTVRSQNGPTACVINCQDGGRAFFFGKRTTPETHLDGVTVTNGALSIGAGIRCQEGSPIISNCIVIGNASWYTGGASGGGFYLDTSNAVIYNCLIAGNAGTRGSGITCLGEASPQIVNCTIVANVGDDTAGGISCGAGTTPLILNSILWDNVADAGPQMRVVGENTIPTIAYCNIQGGQQDVIVGEQADLIWGAGNIDANPRFRSDFMDISEGTWTTDAVYDENAYQTTLFDTNANWNDGELAGKLLQPETEVYAQGLIAANTTNTITVWGDYDSLGLMDVSYRVHDYRIFTCSPCVDAADNAAIPMVSPPADLAGLPRYIDDLFVGDTGNGIAPIVDIGAHEYQADCRTDLNGDHVIDLDDLLTLLRSYNIDDRGDINCDGETNLIDLAEQLGRYGNFCP